MRGKRILGVAALVLAAAGASWVLPRGGQEAAPRNAADARAPEAVPNAEPAPPGHRIVRVRAVAAADDAPVANARVEVRSSRGIDRVASAGDDGRLAVAVSLARARIRAAAPGFAPVEVDAEFCGPDLLLRLLPEARVSGRVVRSDTGESIPGAEVFVLGPEMPPRTLASGRAGADGRFDLGGLAPGAVVLFARAPGWLTPRSRWTGDDGRFPFAHVLEPGERRVADVAVAPAGAAEGYVTLPNGHPAEGAVVRAEPAFGPRSATAPFEDLEATVDSGGWYAISPLRPGPYRLVARLEGYPPTFSPLFEVPDGEARAAALAFAAPRWIDIRVRDVETGEPFADAPVSAAWEGEWTRARTGPDGRARIGPLPPRTVDLLAAPPTARDRFARPVSDREPMPLLVELHRGASIEGRVDLPEGGPAVGAAVAIRPDRPTPAPAVPTGVTDAAGRFRFDGLTAGAKYTISAALAEVDRRLAGTTEAVPGRESVALRLAEGAPLEGESGSARTIRFTDPDGAPVSELEFVPVRRSGRTVRRMGRSPGPAEIVIPEPDAGWDLFLVVVAARDRSGRRLAGGNVGPIPPGPDPFVVRLEPEGRIEGSVVDPEGRAVPGVRVYVAATPLGGTGRWSTSDTFAATISDDDGRFVLGGLPAGTHSVSVLPVRERLVSAIPPVPVGTTDLRIRFTSAASATVTVLDDEDRPLPGATVFYARVGYEGAMASGRTDDRGRCAIGGLDASARYRLRILPPRGRELHPPRIECADWSPAETTFRFEPGWVLEGRVRTADGDPVANALVTAIDAGGEWIVSERTGADGKVRLGSLPGREIRVEVRVGGEVRARVRTRPVAEPVDLEVVSGLPRLDVEVEDGPEGREETQEVRAFLVPMAGGPAWSCAAVRGSTVRFEGLDADTEYGLWIPLGGRAVHETGLRPSETPVRVRTKPAGRISIHLTEVGDAFPRLLLEGPGIRFTVPRGAGPVFTIDGVPEGTFTLRATVHAGGEWRERTARVSPGDDVEIDTR